MKKIIALLALVVLISGCATSQEPNTVFKTVDFFYDMAEYHYKDYEIEIISEPPGAKIEWNNEFIGTTPLKKIINGTGGFGRFIIKAYPISGGQYVQTKILTSMYDNPLPRKIYFDMNLAPVAPSINVNINE